MDEIEKKKDIDEIEIKENEMDTQRKI